MYINTYEIRIHQGELKALRNELSTLRNVHSEAEEAYKVSFYTLLHTFMNTCTQSVLIYI
jgi:hypothetical protein